MRVVLFVAAAVTAAVTAGGCANDVCANIQGTCVALRVEGNGGVSTIEIDTSGAITQTATVSGNNTTLPLLMPLQFHSGVSGAVVLTVQGRLGFSFIGQGVTTAQVIDGQHTTAAVILGGGNDIKVDAGAGGGGGLGGGGGGGTGGGLDMGTFCGGKPCPAGFTCDAIGDCVPVQTMPPGGTCSQDGTILCQNPSECAPDNICRFPCGATVDCMAMAPMSECQSTFASTTQKYCTVMCQAVSPSPTCPNSENCVVVDYSNSTSDCIVPDGKNYKNMSCGTSADCAMGYSCYKKAGQLLGICYGNCMGNNSPCQTPAGGTCQVPPIGGAHWGVCCPSGAGNCL